VKFKMFSTDGQGTDFEGFQIEADSYAEALKEMCGLDGIREHRDFIIQHYDLEEVRNLLDVEGEAGRVIRPLY